jgi:hypothetical protein
LWVKLGYVRVVKLENKTNVSQPTHYPEKNKLEGTFTIVTKTINENETLFPECENFGRKHVYMGVLIFYQYKFLCFLPYFFGF